MKFLVTGGAGFIGSNYLYYVVEKYPEDTFYCLDALTYAGNYSSIAELEKYPNYHFIKGDIRDRAFIDSLFDAERFDVVVNFAAESHVDNSIKNPSIFVETNVLGVVNLLDASKKYHVKRFHQVSTDEVYGDLAFDKPDTFFTETTPLHASSPYSASKASADLEVMAYARTFKLPVTISRCSNNYGPYQFPEKLIPVVIEKALHDEPVPVYGQGLNIRDWIYVKDHCIGVDEVVRHGRVGEVYNLGGRSERRNIDVVKGILKCLGKPESLITYVDDRPGHDLRYAIDCSKAEKELGWKQTHVFEEGLKETVDWYLAHRDWLENIKNGNYRESYKPQKIAIIGANEFQNKLIVKARAKGYETHVFAWASGDIGEKTADHFYPISITEKDEILAKCREIGVSGVCSIASDLASITVNYVSEKLGLCSNPMSITDWCTNKYLMRQKLQESGIPVPGFVKICSDEDVAKVDQLKYPLIVKPTDRSGSRGITKLTSKKGLTAAIAAARKESFEHCAIVEEFIEGEEYSCECISQNGEHHFLAITKKYTTGAPHFIETGHLEPAPLDKKTEQKIVRTLFKAFDALGIKNGASHPEFKIQPNGEIGIIEIGARMGGDCIGSDLVRISTGYDFVGGVIDVATGKTLGDVEAQKTAKNFALVKFLFNEADIKKVEAASKKYADAVFYTSEINRDIKEVTDSSTRLGFVIFSTNSTKVINALKKDLFDEKR